MRRVAVLLALLLMAGAANSSAADKTLTPHRATYKVKISVLSGEMQSRLDLAGDEYAVSSTIKPRGLARLITRGSIQENSTFRIEDEHVRPTSYSSSDSLSKGGGDVRMSFDWEGLEVFREVDGVASRAKLDSVVVDRATLQYALMFDLLNRHIQREYVLIESDEVKKLAVTIKSEKTVKVPYGEYDVIGVSHRAEASTRETTLWCAPSLGYLPVIIEQYRDGKIQGTIVLTEYESQKSVMTTHLKTKE